MKFPDLKRSLAHVPESKLTTLTRFSQLIHLELSSTGSVQQWSRRKTVRPIGEAHYNTKMK